MKRLILAVDPGKKSGICALTHERGQAPVLLSSGEFLMEEYHTPILNSFDYARNLDIEISVVCERFTINAQTIKNSQAPFSIEQIGILKYLMLSSGMDVDSIVFQSPADAKRMFSNEALKKLNYWHRGGEGHALDAIRHGLLYSVKSGWNPIKLLE